MHKGAGRMGGVGGVRAGAGPEAQRCRGSSGAEMSITTLQTYPAIGKETPGASHGAFWKPLALSCRVTLSPHLSCGGLLSLVAALPGHLLGQEAVVRLQGSGGTTGTRSTSAASVRNHSTSATYCTGCGGPTTHTPQRAQHRIA
jgi:hypothetical protein